MSGRIILNYLKFTTLLLENEYGIRWEGPASFIPAKENNFFLLISLEINYLTYDIFEKTFKRCLFFTSFTDFLFFYKSFFNKLYFCLIQLEKCLD